MILLINIFELIWTALKSKFLTLIDPEHEVPYQADVKIIFKKSPAFDCVVQLIDETVQADPCLVANPSAVAVV